MRWKSFSYYRQSRPQIMQEIQKYSLLSNRTRSSTGRQNTHKLVMAPAKQENGVITSAIGDVIACRSERRMTHLSLVESCFSDDIQMITHGTSMAHCLLRPVVAVHIVNEASNNQSTLLPLNKFQQPTRQQGRKEATVLFPHSRCHITVEQSWGLWLEPVYKWNCSLESSL